MYKSLLIAAVLVTMAFARPHSVQHSVCADKSCGECHEVSHHSAHDCHKMPSGHHVRMSCHDDAVVHEVYGKDNKKCQGQALRTEVPQDKCYPSGNVHHKVSCVAPAPEHKKGLMIQRPKPANLTVKGTPTYTICSKQGALLSNPVVTSEPAQWNANSKVIITIKGDLARQVDDGNLHAKATFAGISVMDSTDNFCFYEGTPFTCPLAQGAQTFTIPFDIPSPPFAGKLDSLMELTDASGDEIFCLKIVTQLG
eukprot:PhF_6_TR40598/c0_g1_i1/m.60896